MAAELSVEPDPAPPLVGPAEGSNPPAADGNALTPKCVEAPPLTEADRSGRDTLTEPSVSLALGAASTL
jgi:hypothetical protein